MTAITILLVDDHPVVRMGFQTLLKMNNARYAFHEAENRSEALELAARHIPHAILLDLSLAGAVDFSLIEDLKTASPGSRILVASMHEERLYAERAIRAGANGYLMKNHAAHNIAKAVNTVLEGGTWLSPAMQKQLMARLLNADQSNEWEKISSLSDRELEILRLLGLGLKKSELASRLNLSPNTVETYRTNLKRKLSISTGAELYRFAFLHFQSEGMPK
ncbi:MAG TPA: response regulator transcription factor [Noviherbaspirillum sp.]|nr:response regulator transcription factor [Noviherbaspirillum sp.]